MANIPNVKSIVGRRKTAVATVRLKPGSGKITINKRDIEVYFRRPVSRMILRQPLELTKSADRYDIDASVKGGGLSAQAGAVRHGLSRALVATSEELRGVLKKAGFLTRDAREVERKKYGHHKARKRPQYSKR